MTKQLQDSQKEPFFITEEIGAEMLAAGFDSLFVRGVCATHWRK